MKIEEIKNALKRKAIVFRTGGFRPTNEISESWIGKVGWKLKNEEVPMDDDHQEMLPVATIFLPDSPVCPKELSGIKLITIFDIKNKKIYRCEGNPSRKRFVEDKRLNFI